MTVTAIPPTKPRAEAPPGAPPPAPSGKRRLISIVVAMLIVAGAAYWFLRPAPLPADAAPVPGEVVALEPIQVNLAGGHYLKIGIALQLRAEAPETDGSKALDAVIDLFSGRSMSELASADNRRALKDQLAVRLDELYDGEVIEPYFTDFVTQ
ncbi:flagellar basal body-associated FliL family protein [Nocardioides massiliensis]|uniref:Flagellar protein FliL n=1 Tax=Nocardioides massiliensis TaxID=1325935 RepID=A0ABT9NMZ9_9ACTN|nr:flagellar basal body-associated FliL family protein [Nocardioides massiliensis]MDP9821701.1 flagellar FliL protein [Nocardioides massiliensis]